MIKIYFDKKKRPQHYLRDIPNGSFFIDYSDRKKDNPTLKYKHERNNQTTGMYKLSIFNDVNPGQIRECAGDLAVLPVEVEIEAFLKDEE